MNVSDSLKFKPGDLVRYVSKNPSTPDIEEIVRGEELGLVFSASDTTVEICWCVFPNISYSSRIISSLGLDPRNLQLYRVNHIELVSECE